MPEKSQTPTIFQALSIRYLDHVKLVELLETTFGAEGYEIEVSSRRNLNGMIF